MSWHAKARRRFWPPESCPTSVVLCSSSSRIRRYSSACGPGQERNINTDPGRRANPSKLFSHTNVRGEAKHCAVADACDEGELFGELVQLSQEGLDVLDLPSWSAQYLWGHLLQVTHLPGNKGARDVSSNVSVAGSPAVRSTPSLTQVIVRDVAFQLVCR